MFTATAAVTVLLAALLVATSARKLSHRPEVVGTYTRLGVPEDRLNQLAVVLLAGAAGVLLGLWWAPLGVAAAAGLLAYFGAAIVAHLRAGDTGSLPTPLLFLALAVASLILRLATR